MLIGNEKIEEELHRFSAVVIGPGLSEIPFDFSVFRDFEGTFVVDAGMFDIMPENKEIVGILKDKKVVFTPHQGEIRRFLKAAKALARMMYRGWSVAAPKKPARLRYAIRNWYIPLSCQATPRRHVAA